MKKFSRFEDSEFEACTPVDQENPHGTIIACLQDTAARMEELSRKLTSNAGHPLNNMEKSLCRMATVKAIDDIFARAKAQYLAGNHSDYIADELHAFNQLVDQFNN